MMDSFKPPFEMSNTGMQIRVLGVPQTGAKSRVETQIKLCIQLVTDGGDKALWWSHLKLPENMVTKDKQKKSDTTHNGDLEKMLYLQAKVFCASNPTRKVTTCLGCIQRERKRSQRRKENKMASETTTTDDDSRTLVEDEQQSLLADEERILLFNCSEIVDFSAGDTILPTRITCYCRHHSEKVGFCIYFEMVDYTGKKVAEGISPPIMITDDHKSNKVKSGTKRRRTDSEVTNEMKVPISAPSNWIKSLPFGIGASSSSSSSTPMEQEENKQQQGFPYFPFVSTAAASLSSLSSSRIIPSSAPASAPSTPLLVTPDPSNMLNTYGQLQQQQQQQPIYTRPKLRRLIPTQAPVSGGIEVTILGTDFRPGMTVLFGDTPAKDIQYWSPNTIICTLPPVSNPGAVVVSIRDQPRVKEDLCIFTYLAETDRALMELALQVVGMKMTGVVEDARKIAMRIVQGNGALDNVKKE
ncbi:hypothetical protein K501DRAFT_36932 [Backusella circina FSU 941]|nr:hypothetical protein K501DRAFT_36932 [Backusella circina FSU 941]